MFIRHAMDQDEVYLPYSFNGDWTEEEMKIISDAFEPFIPQSLRVSPTYNNWIISRGNFGYYVKRATWDNVCSFSTAELAAEFITRYHS